MPTYVYEYEKCGYKFEQFQKMSDTPVNVCPECNGKVKRLISSGGGIIIKGSGFHVNDYAKSSCCGATNYCESPKRCCEKE